MGDDNKPLDQTAVADPNAVGQAPAADPAVATPPVDQGATSVAPQQTPQVGGPMGMTPDTVPGTTPSASASTQTGGPMNVPQGTEPAPTADPLAQSAPQPSAVPGMPEEDKQPV